MFVLCILLCAVSGRAAGQHLGRIPLARVTVTNPGEFGLIPGQPFWPPITKPPPTTSPPLNPPITAASPPVAAEHASAHLNEIEVKGEGIRVQDHGYRTPPKGKSQPIAPIILQALRRLEARPGPVKGAGLPLQGGAFPLAATALLAGNTQALNPAFPVIPGRAPALPATTTTLSPFKTARRPSPQTKALIQALLRTRNQRLRGFGGTPGIPPPTSLRGLNGPLTTPSPALADKLATLLPASTPLTTPTTPTTPTTTTTTATTTQRPRPNTIVSLVDPEMAPSPLHVQEEELPLPDPSESVFGRRIPENGHGSAVFEASSGVAKVPQPDKRAPLAPQQLSQAEKIIELPAVADRPRPGESVEEHAGKPSHASVSRVPHVTQAAQQKPETPLGPPPHLLGQIPVLVEATPPPSVGNRHGASTREPTPPQANSGPAADPFTAVFEALNQKLTSQPPSRPTRIPGPSDDYYYYYDDYDDDYYYYDYDYPRRQIGPQRGRFRFPATNPRQPTFAGVSQRRVPFAAASLPRQPPAGNFPSTTSLPRGFNTPFVPTTLARVATLAPGSTTNPIALVSRPVLPPRPAPPPALTRPAPRVQPRPITPPPSLFATQAPVRTPARHDEALEGLQVQPHQGFPSRHEAPPPQLPSSQGGAQVSLEAPVAPGLPSSKPNPTSSTVFKMTASPHPSEALGRPGDPPSTLPPRPIPPPSLQQQPPPPPAKTRPQFQDTGSPKSQSEQLSASGPPLRAPELPLSDQGEAPEPRIQGAVGPDDRLTLLVSPEQLRRLQHTKTSTPTLRKQPVYFLPPEATLPELATQIRRRRRPDARVGGPEGGSWQNQTPTSSPLEPREGRKDSPMRESTSPQEETAISPPAGPQPPPTAARLQAPQESIPERANLHDNNAFSSRHNISEDSVILEGVSPSKRFPESQDTDPQRPERGRRPQFSRLPLVGFTGAQALGDYAEPEDASSQKDEATPPGAPEIEREIPNRHVQEQANRPAGATPHDSPRGEGRAPPHDGILEEAAPFDESIIANHDGESVPEVQGWRKDLPYPNITIPVESPALSGLPFYISGKKDLGPFFIVALD